MRVTKWLVTTAGLPLHAAFADKAAALAYATKMVVDGWAKVAVTPVNA
jgi:hypothetical protein